MRPIRTVPPRPESPPLAGATMWTPRSSSAAAPALLSPFAAHPPPPPPHTSHRPHNLYIKHIPQTMDTSGLHDLFGRFGDVVAARILLDARAESKGCGFCQLATEGEAAAAIAGLQGRWFEGSGRPLVVSRARSRDERQGEARVARAARRAAMARAAALGAPPAAPPGGVVPAGGYLFATAAELALPPGTRLRPVIAALGGGYIVPRAEHEAGVAVLARRVGPPFVAAARLAAARAGAAPAKAAGQGGPEK